MSGRQTERPKVDAARLCVCLSHRSLSVFLSRSPSLCQNHTHLIVTLSCLNTSFQSHNPQVLLKHIYTHTRVGERAQEWVCGNDIISTEGLRQAKWVQPFWVIFRSRMDFIQFLLYWLTLFFLVLPFFLSLSFLFSCCCILSLPHSFLPLFQYLCHFYTFCSSSPNFVYFFFLLFVCSLCWLFLFIFGLWLYCHHHAFHSSFLLSFTPSF